MSESTPPISSARFSEMRLFFGSKKEKQQPAATQSASSNTGLPDAIQKNKIAIDTLEKRQKLLEKRIADEEADAKTRVASNDKRGALMALKRKKMLETELETLMNSRMTLEQQINSLEAAQMNQIAVSALAHGVNVHKQLNQQIDVEHVDQLMEDMQEQLDLQNEIAQVMSAGNRIGEDEDLMRELEQLQEATLDEQLIGAGSVPSGPVADKSAPVAAKAATTAAPAPVTAGGLTADEEAELAALQQGLS
jgi:charged multivesicular body protein 4